MNQITYHSNTGDPLVPVEGRAIKSQGIQDNFKVLDSAASLWAYENDPVDLTVVVTQGPYQIDIAESLFFPGGVSPVLDTTGDQGFGPGIAGDSRSAVLVLDGSQVLTWIYGDWSPSGTPSVVTPTFPSDKVAICEVTAALGATEINQNALNDVRPMIALRSAVVGGGATGVQGATGVAGSTGPSGLVSVLPADFVSGTAFSTPATIFTDVTSTSITIASDTRIFGIFTADVGVNVANRDVTLRVVIGANNGPEVVYTFQLSDEVMAGAVQFLSGVLTAAGSPYTVKAQVKVSNADTIVTLSNFNLAAIGLEGVQGATGPAGVSLDEAYTAGQSINVDLGPVSLSNVAPTASLVISKTNVGGGNVIDITNAGTGKDIEGHLGNWFVESNGDATFGGKLTVSGGIDPIYLEFAPTTSASVPGNNSFFVDSADSNKLKYKDSTATIADVGLGIASTLQSAYDAGQTIATDLGTLAITNTAATQAMSITQNGNAGGLLVDWNDTTGGGTAFQVDYAGRLEGVVINHSPNPGLNDRAVVINKNIVTNQTCFEVNDVGSGSAITINKTGASGGSGLTVVKSGAAGGTCVNIINTAGNGQSLAINHTAANTAVSITKNSTQAGATVDIFTTNTGTAGNSVQITNSGAGAGLLIAQDGSGRALEINQAGGNRSLTITKSNTNGSDCINVTNSGAGAGIFVAQVGEGIVADLNKTATGSANVIDITNAGTGNDISGHGGNWSIDKDGDATFNTVTVPIFTYPSVSAVLDLSQSNNFYVLLDQNKSITSFTNPTSGAKYTFIITQDGVGGRTFTFPGAVKWRGGTAPTITTTPSRTDIVTIMYNDATGEFFGDITQDFS